MKSLMEVSGVNMRLHGWKSTLDRLRWCLPEPWQVMKPARLDGEANAIAEATVEAADLML